MKELAWRQYNKRNLVRTLNSLQVLHTSQQEDDFRLWKLLIKCLFPGRRHLENHFDCFVFGFFSVAKLKHKLSSQMTSTGHEGWQQTKKKIGVNSPWPHLVCDSLCKSRHSELQIFIAHAIVASLTVGHRWHCRDRKKALCRELSGTAGLQASLLDTFEEQSIKKYVWNMAAWTTTHKAEIRTF